MIALNEDPGGRVMTLAEIESRCAAYEAESAKLEDLISMLESDLEEVKRRHLRGLKRQAAVVAAHEAELRSAVESAPELFKKPRTMTVHGVKVGFAVSNGRVVWDDADLVLQLIKRHRKDDRDVLIRTSEEPNKDALKALPASDLAKLGCRIDGAGDQVIVKRTAGEVEKLIAKLIDKLVEAMVEE